MLRVKNSNAKNTASFLTKATEAAQAFGFDEFDNALNKYKSHRLPAADKLNHIQPREKAILPHIRKVASKDIDPNHHILGYVEKMDSKTNGTFTLMINGVTHPIAEATLIATAFTLLEDIGLSDATVHINSLGTHDSFSRYIKDLEIHLKKLRKDLPKQVITHISKSPLRAYGVLCKIDKTLSSRFPQPIDYLNDDGRTHLWELLEYLEDTEIPYVLDNTVIGSNDYFDQTLFEIQTSTDTIAYGGRYDQTVRNAFKKQSPFTALTIDFSGSGPYAHKKQEPKQTHIFFAQLGYKAKKLALKVLRNLHQAGISVHHYFTHKSLSPQMQTIEAQDAKYIVIIGQKEAVNNVAIVRNTVTHKQRLIPINKLVNHLKKL